MDLKAHVSLLRQHLEQRAEIVARIESVLGGLRKAPPSDTQLTADIDACFGQATLRNELEQAHWAAGFLPRPVEHIYNDLINPAEMMLRGAHCWRQTWWPGRGARMHYSQTLFNVYVLRWLQFLSLQALAGNGLAELQTVLDELWRSSPSGQPVMVRDARWLIPLAQSLITDALAPYFDVAEQVVAKLSGADALEVQKAQVRTLGGHLTSQIRYYCTSEGVPLAHPSVVRRTRNSNALDLALLVQGLVALLRAYEQALQRGDQRQRREMAGAIFQGISPDPELFLNQVSVLKAYTMIEHVFVDRVPLVAYTQQGLRHVALAGEYATLINRLRPELCHDLPHFRPAPGGCSPYGVVFGLPSTLIEHMTLKAVQQDAEIRFSLEDIFDEFADAHTGAAKLAWVNGWRDLPHIPPEVRKMFDYPQNFAEEIFHRIEQELTQRESVVPGRLLLGDSEAPELSSRYFLAADKQDPAPFHAGRIEGHFLVSYETSPECWAAIKKDVLTEVLAAGQSARVSDLPPETEQTLRCMCGELAD